MVDHSFAMARARMAARTKKSARVWAIRLAARTKTSGGLAPRKLLSGKRTSSEGASESTDANKKGRYGDLIQLDGSLSLPVEARRADGADDDDDSDDDDDDGDDDDDKYNHISSVEISKVGEVAVVPAGERKRGGSLHASKGANKNALMWRQAQPWKSAWRPWQPAEQTASDDDNQDDSREGASESTDAGKKSSKAIFDYSLR